MPEAWSATIPAASPSQVDVSNAVRVAVSGDTVTIPAGTARWTNTIQILKAIQLIGAGIGQTIIFDDTATDIPLLQVIPDNSSLSRISGIEFSKGVRNTTLFHGVIQYYGSSQRVRIDNCRFNLINNACIVTANATCGVVDHCTFWRANTFGIQIHHDQWGGRANGDGSWADADLLGTTNAMYVESCVFTNNGSAPGSIDSELGGRFVYRYNISTNDSLGFHGTDSSARERGARTFEIYGNTMFWSTNQVNQLSPNAILARSGVGVVFSNACWNYNWIMILAAYRQLPEMWVPWGPVTGANPWDLQDGVIYATGTHNGGNGNQTLVDTNQSWVVNQWQGYTCNATNAMMGSTISSNSATTLTLVPDRNPALNIAFTNGETYEIRKTIRSLDQPGSGQGDLVGEGSGNMGNPYNQSPGTWGSPYNTRTGVASWPNQVISPIYQWSNIVIVQIPNNVQSNQIASQSQTIQPLRDFFDYTIKPGYTPLVFPHPLVVPPVPPSSPTFTVQPFGGLVGVGQGWTFTSLAVGDPVITYQWRKGGVNLAGNTDSNLVLSNVQLTDSGVYDVAATNGAGFAISSPATLTVTPSPPPSPPTVFRIISVSGKVITNIFQQ